MTDLARQNGSESDVSWQSLNLMEKIVAVDGLLPHDVTSLIPRDLSQDEFAKGLVAAESVSHKGALWWGQIYRAGVELYGDDFYQSLTGIQYQKSTLQNYARLTRQIHPDLWAEPIEDRHFMAIGQNVDSLEEQRRWVEYVKEHNPTADDLRHTIHEDLEARGLRQRIRRATWHECHVCHGRGGWIEDDEN